MALDGVGAHDSAGCARCARDRCRPSERAIEARPIETCRQSLRPSPQLQGTTSSYEGPGRATELARLKGASSKPMSRPEFRRIATCGYKGAHQAKIHLVH
jgi:hypothetical protein